MHHNNIHYCRIIGELKFECTAVTDKLEEAVQSYTEDKVQCFIEFVSQIWNLYSLHYLVSGGNIQLKGIPENELN